MQQSDVLGFLKQQGKKLAMRDIAGSLGITPSSTYKQLRIMKKCGLVKTCSKQVRYANNARHLVKVYYV